MIWIHAARGLHRAIAHFKAFLLLKVLIGMQNGVMLDGAAYQVTTLGLAQTCSAKHGQVVAFGAAPRKNDLTGFALPPIRHAVSVLIQEGSSLPP